MAFELFDKRSVALDETPTVSIQKKGIFALNRAAYDALGEPDAVQLLYDREKQLVGFRPAKRTAQHAYPLRPNTRRSSHLVTGTLFCKHYGIPTDTTRRCPAHLQDNLLCIAVGDA